MCCFDGVLRAVLVCENSKKKEIPPPCARPSDWVCSGSGGEYAATSAVPRMSLITTTVVFVNKKKTKADEERTPNGGSLGSWVDEERSKLRVIV